MSKCPPLARAGIAPDLPFEGARPVGSRASPTGLKWSGTRAIGYDIDPDADLAAHESSGA